AVDQSVGALGGFDRRTQRDPAAEVHPVGEQDNRFPAGLLLHQLVAGEQDGIIEDGAAAASGPTASAAAGKRTNRPAALPVASELWGRVELVQGFLQQSLG